MWGERPRGSFFLGGLFIQKKFSKRMESTFQKKKKVPIQRGLRSAKGRRGSQRRIRRLFFKRNGVKKDRMWGGEPPHRFLPRNTGGAGEKKRPPLQKPAFGRKKKLRGRKGNGKEKNGGEAEAQTKKKGPCFPRGIRQGKVNQKTGPRKFSVRGITENSEKNAPEKKNSLWQNLPEEKTKREVSGGRVCLSEEKVHASIKRGRGGGCHPSAKGKKKRKRIPKKKNSQEEMGKKKNGKRSPIKSQGGFFGGGSELKKKGRERKTRGEKGGLETQHNLFR